MAYNFQFEMPFELKVSGLKLVTQGQIDFMIKLFNRDESILPIISNECYPTLSWYVRSGYAEASFHVDADIPANRFINYSFSASPPESFQQYKKFGSVEGLVEFLEVRYQLNENLSVWVSPDEDEFGYEPNFEDDVYYLVPLTLERIQRIPQPMRREKLDELSGWLEDKSHFQYRFKLLDEEVENIWYGETGFRLKTMLAAEKGDQTAIKAWAAIK